MGEAIRNTNRDVTRTASNVRDNLGKSFSNLGGIVKRAFAALAIGSGVKAMADLSIKAEQTSIAFETMMGSASAATDMIKQLTDFAAATPFGQDQVIQGGRQLLAYGVAADTVKDKLKLLGDISAGTGKDFNELISIYGKNKMSGLIQGEDLNQLNDAGIPAVREIAKVMGVQETAVRKLASEGKISFNIFEQALGNMVKQGGLYFNLMEKQSQSLGGRISSLTDSFMILATKVGDKFIAPLLGKIVQFSNEFMSNLEPIKQAFSSLGTAFQPFIDGINQMGIALGLWSEEGVNGAIVAQNFANIINTYLVPVIQVAANVFRTLTGFISRNSELVKGLLAAAAGAFAFIKVFQMIRTAIAVVQAMRVAILAMNAALWANPIGLIIGLIGALIGAFIYAWNEVEGFKEAFVAAFDTATYVFKNFGSIVSKILSNIGQFFKETFQPFFEAIELIKKGEYSKAALAIGKGLLNVTTIPLRFTAALATGDLFEGTGIGDTFKKSFNSELKKTRDEKANQARFDNLKKDLLLNKKDGASTTSGPSGTIASNQQSLTPPDEAVKLRSGSGPQSVVLHFEPVINVNVNSSVAESRETIQQELDKLLAESVNGTMRRIK